MTPAATLTSLPEGAACVIQGLEGSHGWKNALHPMLGGTESGAGRERRMSAGNCVLSSLFYTLMRQGRLCRSCECSTPPPAERRAENGPKELSRLPPQKAIKSDLYFGTRMLLQRNERKDIHPYTQIRAQY